MRLQAALAGFQTKLQADGRSPHTVAQYARHVRRFGAWLEADRVPDKVRLLEPEYVAAFIAAAEAQRRRDGCPRRAGSLNALRSSLRGFFGYLERACIVERSPGRVLRMARGAPAAPRGMRADDVTEPLAVLAVETRFAGRRDHTLVGYLGGTGARLGSALAWTTRISTAPQGSQRDASSRAAVRCRSSPGSSSTRPSPPESAAGTAAQRSSRTTKWR